MGFIKRLFGGGERTQEDRGIHLYIECQRCGAPVHVRIDPQNELAADYGDAGAEGYQVVKEITDDRCFRRMRAELHFDAHRRETSRQLEGGEFITADEYAALRVERAAKPRAG